MEDNKSMEVFAKAPIRKAVLQNALPAMAAMLMVLIYNLADTFFIGQTHDDLQVAAVSLATPVFLLFMSVGTVFGIGGTSVISRALGEGRRDYAPKAKERAAAIERTANERAQEGWELITFSVTNSDKSIVLFHVPNAVQLGDVIQEEIDDGRFRGALRRSGNRCAEEE